MFFTQDPPLKLGTKVTRAGKKAAGLLPNESLEHTTCESEAFVVRNMGKTVTLWAVGALLTDKGKP